MVTMGFQVSNYLIIQLFILVSEHDDWVRQHL